MSGNDYVHDMSSDSDGRVIFAGKTYGSYAATNLGSGDYVAVMLNTSALDTPALTTPLLSPTPTPAPPSAATPITPPGTTQGTSNVAPIAAGVASAVAGAALIALGLFLLKRKRDKKNISARQVHPPVVAVHRENRPPVHQHNPAAPPPLYRRTVASSHQHPAPPPPPYQRATAARQQHFARPAPPYLRTTASAGVEAASGTDINGEGRHVISAHPAAVAVKHAGNATAQFGKNVSGGGSGDALGGSYLPEGYTEPSASVDKSGGRTGVAQDGAGGGLVDHTLIVTTSTINMSTGERKTFTPAYGGIGVAGAAVATDEPTPTLDEIRASSSTDDRRSSGGPGLGRAVGEAALELARSCLIPGVSEAASTVSILVDLITGNQDTINGTEPSLRRCRSIVLMLQKAAKVLGKVSQQYTERAVASSARLYRVCCLHTYSYIPFPRSTRSPRDDPTQFRGRHTPRSVSIVSIITIDACRSPKQVLF